MRKSKKSTKENKFEVIKNMNITDYLVIICIGSIVVFTVFVMYQYYYRGIPVIELKTEVYTFFGVELMSMATISISDNLARRNRKEDLEELEKQKEADE